MKHQGANSLEDARSLRGQNKQDLNQQTVEGSSHGTEGTLKVWIHFCWIPFAFGLLSLMLRYAVDIPTTNQWDIEVPFLMQLWKGSWGVHDFIAQKFEYRPLVQRVITFITARFFGYSMEFMVVVNWIAVVLTMINVCVLAGRSLARTAVSLVPPLLLTTAALFNLSQYEIYLDASVGWTVEWLFMTTGFVIAGSHLQDRVKITACAILALLSSFCVVVGVFAWVAFLPALVPFTSWAEVRKKRAVLGMWAGLAVVAVGLYAWNYERPPLVEVPSMQVGPSVFLQFLLGYLGVPFAFGTAFNPLDLSMFCGLLLLVCHCLVWIYSWLRRTDSRYIEAAIPWLMLGAMGLFTAVATTVGRAGFGVPRSISSRYVNQNLFTVISLFFLVPAILTHWRNSRIKTDTSLLVRTASTLPVAATTLAFFLYVCNSVHAMDAFRSWRSNWLMAKAAMLFSPCFAEDQILKAMWQRTAQEMSPRLEFLDENGFLRPKLIRDKRISALEKIEVNDPQIKARLGSLEQAITPAQNVIQITGWATHPKSNRSADAVLLTWEKSTGEGEVFAVAQMGIPREDVSAKWGKDFRLSGWGKVFPAAILPRGDLKLKAWAFDTQLGKATELAGSLDIKIP